MGLMVPFENQSKAPHVRYTPRRTIHLNTGGENSAKNTIVIKLITIELIIGTIQKINEIWVYPCRANKGGISKLNYRFLA